MDAKKSASTKHVTLLPDVLDKTTLFNLIKELFSPNISKSNLLQHNIPKDKENKYFHRRVIIVSLLIQILLKCLGDPLKKFGSTVEDFLNGKVYLRKREERALEEDDDGFISFLGQLDRRKELNKDIKHGDSRYYPALSMMASKLAYENEFYIRTIVSHYWKMEYVKFYNCYNEYLKKPTTQAFIMHEETTKEDKIIVAFRGTEPFDADDWSTDFDFSWCKIDKMGKIHMGFMVALGLQKYFHEDDDEEDEDYYGLFPEQVEPDPEKPLAYYVIRDTLKEIMANNKRAKIIVTGHSLGGALAILFPAVLALHGEVELLDKMEAIYTYGQPRVGNKEFGEFMKNNLRKHKIKYYRIVYGNDIVPTVPWDNTLMTFKHFGTCIHFNSLYQGKIIEEEQEKPVKKNEKEGLKKYLKLLKGMVVILVKCLIARVSAVWELIRGFIMGYVAGPYYREGWLLIGFRMVGILFPGVANHNPQDYVNATMFASQDLFKYYPALTP